MTQVTKQRPATPKQAGRRSSPLDKALDYELFKALSDPTRVRLLACLAKCGRMCSVTEVAQCCSVDFSVVSRHLSMLEDVGVLESQKQGRTVYYRVEYERLSSSLRELASAFEQCCPEDCACDRSCGCSPAPAPPSATPSRRRTS